MKITKTGLIGMIIGLAAFVVLSVAVVWVASAVYLQRSDSKIVRAVASWLPAAKVGKHTITYGDFLDTRDTLKIYMNSQVAKDMGFAQQVTAEVEKNSFERLVREKIVDDLAVEKNVSLADADVKQAFTMMTEQTSSTIPDVGKYLKDNFGWTEDQYRDQILRPAMLEERLAVAMSSSTDEQLSLLEQEVAKRMADPDVKIYLKF